MADHRLTAEPLPPRLLGFVALAALLAGSHPFAPLWYDEIYTLSVFLPQGPAGFLADYHLPNNHLAYTLFLWAWHALAGDAVLPLRAGTLLLSACALPAVYVAGRALAGPRAGALAALVLGSSQVFASFAAQLRGYGPSVALVAIALAGAAVWWRSGFRDRRGLAAWVAAGALAVWTVPTNLVFVAAIALWLLGSAPGSWSGRGCARLAWLAAPALGLLGYAGAWRQVVAWSGSPIWPTWPGFAGVLAHDVLLGDLPWLVPVVVLVAAVPATRRATPRGTWMLLVAVLAALLVPLLGPVPWPRNYVPLLALVALAAGLLIDRLAALVPGGAATLAALLLAIALARPLWQPATDVHAAATQTPMAGELLAPYYLQPGFEPAAALAAYRDDPTPTLFVMANTTFLELEPVLLGLPADNTLCQVLPAPADAEAPVSCIARTAGGTAPARLVVIAATQADTVRLRLAVGAATGFVLPAGPLAPEPAATPFFRTWTAPLS